MKRVLFLLAITMAASACSPAVVEVKRDEALDQVVQIRYERLRTQLAMLREYGEAGLADRIEGILGPTPSADAVEQASRLVQEWIEESKEREPAYCSDEGLTRHMRDLMEKCERVGKCDDFVSAPQYFASEAQYKSLVALMPKTTVFFGKGKTEADDFYRGKLLAFSRQHIDTSSPHAYVFVVGRASKTGKYDRNLVLAASRARSIVSALRDAGQVMQRIGWTAYSQYQIYVTQEDWSLMDESNQQEMSVDELNQSATVFVYNCPRTVKKWKDEWHLP